jgi:hypothetical protein
MKAPVVKLSLDHPFVLYFVLMVALANLLYLSVGGNLAFAVVFLLVGFLTSFFSKNMTVILVIAIVATNVLQFGSGVRISEGLENKEDDEEGFAEGAEDEKKEVDEKKDDEKEVDEKKTNDKEKTDDKKKKTEEGMDTDKTDAAVDRISEKQKKIAEKIEKIEPMVKNIESFMDKLEKFSKY